MSESIQEMDRLRLQLRRARLPGVRDLEVPDRHPREGRLHGRARRRRHSDGVVAPWGSGKPVIALGSDIDCIPQASQKPGVAYHDPIIEGAPGHGEGHNSGMPLNITAALAVKKIMEREKLPGTLMLWPGVAEELVGTKAYYVRAGVFKDVDVALFTHVGDEPRCQLGRRQRRTAWSRSSTRSRARARTPPARRGAAGPRSTPSN